MNMRIRFVGRGVRQRFRRRVTSPGAGSDHDFGCQGRRTARMSFAVRMPWWCAAGVANRESSWVGSGCGGIAERFR